MPDADPTTPGVIAEASNFIPTDRGYAPDFSMATSQRFPVTLPARVFSADSTFLDNGSPLCLFGTATNLYVADGATLTLRSRAAPYATINAGTEWRFATFMTASGTFVMASNALNDMQVTSNASTTNFADLAGAPRANTICVQRNFVIGAQFFTGAWPYQDGWWCCGQENHTTWTPDIATQAARGRLTVTPGAIIRLVAFQDSVIAFKFASMYRGFYSGPTDNTWSFPLLSKSIGLISHDAVAEADGVLYWMGTAGFYRYAGAQIERISGSPWATAKTLIRGLNTVRCVWDPVRRVVRWYVGSPALEDGKTYGFTYHVDTGRWGTFLDNSNCAFSIPIDRVPTIDGYDQFVIDPIEWTTFSPVGVIDSTTNALMTYSGPPAASSFTTGDIGDDDAVTGMMRARVRFLSAPTTATITHYHRMQLGDALTTGETATRTDGKYDISHASRWHRLKFLQTGNYEVSGFRVLPARAGNR